MPNSEVMNKLKCCISIKLIHSSQSVLHKRTSVFIPILQMWKLRYRKVTSSRSYNESVTESEVKSRSSDSQIAKIHSLGLHTFVSVGFISDAFVATVEGGCVWKKIIKTLLQNDSTFT